MRNGRDRCDNGHIALVLQWSKMKRKYSCKNSIVMRNEKTDIRIFGGIVCFVVFAFGILYLPSGQVIADSGPKPTPTPKKVKYTEFPHNQKAHQMECGTCHKFPSDNWNKVRAGDAAFPDITDYPKHQSCLKCHKQQF